MVTLRFYVHVAPFWVVLTVSGVASLAVALILRRYLGSGPGGERHGFTAEPLYESMARTHVLEMGMAAALEPGAAEKPTRRRSVVAAASSAAAVQATSGEAGDGLVQA